MNGLMGRKIGMTRIFDSKGRNVPVTVISAGPCYITQIKRVETDGYNAVQVGFDEKKEKHTNKPELGHFAKSNTKPMRLLKEFRVQELPEDVTLGGPIDVSIFAEGEVVKVTGWSKGKGFQGVVKRHGFRGGPKTHGQSDRLRAPGSLGQSSYPARVFKGIRMGGRMGNDKVTLKSVKVVRVDKDKHLIMVKGGVPGSDNGYVIIRKNAS
ncbi:MAG: 50S ribosomal protein L3 [bacterium]